MSSSPTVSSTETTGPGNAAFGRGDVPAILAALADDVRWEEWAAKHIAVTRGEATQGD